MASSSSDQNRKTNKFGIVIRDEDQLDQFIEFFTEYHYMAVISPLHNEDHWTKTDIERAEAFACSCHTVMRHGRDAKEWP